MNKAAQIKTLLPQLRNIDRAGLSMADQKVLQSTIDLMENLYPDFEAVTNLPKLVETAVNEAFLRNLGKAVPLSKQSVTLIAKQLENFVSIVEQVPVLDWRDNKGRRLKDNEHYVGLYVLSHQLKHVAEDPNQMDLPEDICQNLSTVQN